MPPALLPAGITNTASHRHPSPHPLGCEQITFPDKPRLGLLTTADGAKFSKGDSKCPNRVFFDRTTGYTPTKLLQTDYTVPCGGEAQNI